MKKAQTTPSWMLVIIILAVVALVIGMYVLFKLGETEADVEDKLCKQSNWLRSSTTVPGFGEARPADLVPESPKICITQYVTINANDYNACNSNASHVRTLEGLRECAAHQIADLVNRCWWMGGEGLWGQPGSWKCFTGKIVINQYENEESQIEVWKSLQSKLRTELKCTSSDRLTKTGVVCSELAGEIVEKLVLRLAYNGLLSYYNNISTEDDPHTSDIEDAQNRITELNNEISLSLTNSLKDPNEILSIDVCKKYKAGCEAIAGENYDDKCCDEWETHNPTQLESTFEATLTIGGVLPDIGTIKESDIKKVLDSNVAKRFEFLDENYEINQNSLFEIGFCDPPIEIGSGPLARMGCNELDGQKIQLDKGGLVGTSREGSPYCNVFNALNKVPFIKDVDKYCGPATKRQ